MNVFHLLFGFSGRINRARFWLAVLIYAVFFFSGILLLIAFTTSLTAVFGATLLLYLPIAVSGIAVGIKRLHDRNKSGWWLLVFFAGPLLLQTLAYFAFGAPDDSAEGLPYQILALASLGINIWALIELGCLRGSIGPNQYGPDPVAPAPAMPRTVR